MAEVFERQRRLTRWFAAIERALYRLCRINPSASMSWQQYALCMLAFNAMGAFAVYALQRLQAVLPLEPAADGAGRADSSFNTAVSFITNTNWQGYGGESTMSYLTQMLGAGGAELPVGGHRDRGAGGPDPRLRAEAGQHIGNFWVDLTRATLYVLLPLSLLLAVVLAGQGVVQSFKPYQTAALVNPITVDEPLTDAAGNPVKDEKGNQRPRACGSTPRPSRSGRRPARSPSSSSAPTAAASSTPTRRIRSRIRPRSRNFLEVLAILLIRRRCAYTFGLMVGRPAPGLGGAGGDAGAVHAAVVTGRRGRKAAGNPAYPAGVAQARRRGNRAATWRARRPASASPIRRSLAAATTAASNGSVNSMHDSLHAARRPGSDVADTARRGDLRRRRLRPVRHAGVCHHRRIHRRADGRAHARISGQEDRSLRDEDGLARRS